MIIDQLAASCGLQEVVVVVVEEEEEEEEDACHGHMFLLCRNAMTAHSRRS
jgi:hypothetical protein